MQIVGKKKEWEMLNKMKSDLVSQHIQMDLIAHMRF